MALLPALDLHAESRAAFAAELSSAELEQPVIRMAIPIDYQRDGPGFTYLDGDGVSPSSRNGRQWHVGTRQFAEDTAPPADMWRGWAI